MRTTVIITRRGEGYISTVSGRFGGGHQPSSAVTRSGIRCNAWLGINFERMMVGMELVLIRGLPGSGKTTMARALARNGYDHHEADHYFERGGSYKFDPTELPKAHAQCLERTKDSLARGVSCVVANTFTRRWEMQPYLDAAQEAGVTVRVIEARGEWENCHGVPASAIERMRDRWESVDA